MTIKGFHPTLHSITMRELLANGSATTEKGTYSLIKKPPYISFQYAPKPVPNYEALRELIDEYGLSPVNKVSNGGGLWLAGEKHDELITDFLKNSRETGCVFEFYKDSKALRHKSGWCHRVEPENEKRFEEAFNKKKNKASPVEPLIRSVKKEKDPVIEVIKKSGLEYVDKRPKGGSLWIVAGETEGKPVTDQCQKLGVRFKFHATGGRASKYRPAWYSTT